MSGELLREAAALMRERAEAATPGGPRWETGPDEMHGPSQMIVFPSDSDSAVAFAGADDAPHIASWHPAVALAVADWLDATAHELDALGDPDLSRHPQDGRRTAGVAVARAYLGGAS